MSSFEYVILHSVRIISLYTTTTFKGAMPSQSATNAWDSAVTPMKYSRVEATVRIPRRALRNLHA